MSYRDNIFTVFDLMEKKGVFRSNPANRDSQDDASKQSLYKGPVEYPKMLYHPEGKTRITVPAEIISTPIGAREVGQQVEIINKLVNSREEETVLKALGWHNQPAKAIHAGGGAAPPVSSEEAILSLEAQVKALLAQLEAAKDSVEIDQSHEAKATRALSEAAA